MYSGTYTCTFEYKHEYIYIFICILKVEMQTYIIYPAYAHYTSLFNQLHKTNIFIVCHIYKLLYFNQ